MTPPCTHHLPRPSPATISLPLQRAGRLGAGGAAPGRRQAAAVLPPAESGGGAARRHCQGGYSALGGLGFLVQVVCTGGYEGHLHIIPVTVVVEEPIIVVLGNPNP